MSTQLVIWLVTGIVVVLGVAWLVARAIQSGQKLPGPKTTQYDQQDAPPADGKS